MPGGPLDSAAYIVGRAGGRAGRPVLLPMEIKNVRHWLFPRAIELFQGLDKSAQLLAADPGVQLVPVIICRRKHHTAFNMATDVGFFIIEVHRQFMLPSAYAPIERVEEVRTELGFHFLAPTVDADPILVKVFKGTVPERAERLAARFASTAPILAPYFTKLRDARLPSAARSTLFDKFREVARGISGAAGGW